MAVDIETSSGYDGSYDGLYPESASATGEPGQIITLPNGRTAIVNPDGSLTDLQTGYPVSPTGEVQTPPAPTYTSPRPIYADPNYPSQDTIIGYEPDPYAAAAPPTSTTTAPAPTAKTEQTDPWATAPADGNWEAWFLKNVQGLTPNSATLISLEPKLAAHGIKVLRNAEGTAGKIQMRDGSIVDVGRSFSGSDPTAMGWQWSVGGGGTTTGTSDSTSTADIDGIVSAIPDSFYPAPEPFEYPEFVAPEFEAPEFVAPDPFQYPEFVAPSGEQVLAEDPGYGFREGQMLRAVRNDASARGILKSGATAKSLMDYAGGLASQEYGNAFNRRFGTWQANRGAAAEDYDRLWRNLLTDYGVKYDAEQAEYDRARQTYGTNLGTAATEYGFDLDRAAGIAGGTQGATSLAGNLALGAGSLSLNTDNSRFRNLLDLYDISVRNLPKYTPTPSSSYGFSGA